MFDGELHTKQLLESSLLRLCVNNIFFFFAEVKDFQQQGTLEKVTEPTEWASAPTVVKNKPFAKNGIRLCKGCRQLNIAHKRYEYPNSAVDHLLTEIGNANKSIFFS